MVDVISLTINHLSFACAVTISIRFKNHFQKPLKKKRKRYESSTWKIHSFFLFFGYGFVGVGVEALSILKHEKIRDI